MVKGMEPDKKSKIRTGKAGEDIAAEYLAKSGLRILDRNFRFGRFGEIDIIAAEGEYLCFTEVKTRTGIGFGYPSEAVVQKKQKSIRSLAQIYLKLHNLKDAYVRFDIVEVIVRRNAESLETVSVNLIKNAF